MTDSIRVYFESRGVTIIDLWNTVHECLRQDGLDEVFEVGRGKLKRDGVEAYVRGLPSEDSAIFVNERFYISLMPIERHGVMMLNLMRHDEPHVETMNRWLDAIVRQLASKLICGRLRNSGYEAWQREESVEECERYRREFSHLPRKKQDGKLIIDIKKNPGAAIYREGYDEVAGGIMWLGPYFRKRTGGDWRKLRQYPWCQIQEFENGLVRVQSWPEAFDSDQGEQRDRQWTLLSTLYPKTFPLRGVEWPEPTPTTSPSAATKRTATTPRKTPRPANKKTKKP
jgi:hypothetical protein